MTSSSAGVQKVAIIGGGVAGLTLALALQRHGIRVSVHEKYDHYQSQSTGFLIWSYAIKILQDLDVPVQNFGAPLEVFRMHGRKGQPVVDMPIGAVSRRNGAESYEVNRRRLSQTLAATVGNDLVLGQECVSVVNDPDHATAHFADGSCVDADVVIACDGANSALRQQMFPDVRLRMLGSGGWIAVIDVIPEGLEPGVQMDFWLPGCKAGVAQLGHGETRWYVAFNTIQPQADVAKKEQIQQQIVVGRKRPPEQTRDERHAQHRKVREMLKVACPGVRGHGHALPPRVARFVVGCVALWTTGQQPDRRMASEVVETNLAEHAARLRRRRREGVGDLRPRLVVVADQVVERHRAV